MPQIYDNIQTKPLPRLLETAEGSSRSSFCVGYFNLRGWRLLYKGIDHYFGEDDGYCRLLVGMTPRLDHELREAVCATQPTEEIDRPKVKRLLRKLVLEFLDQLMVGSPANDDEQGLWLLRDQLMAKKLRVRLFLRHSPHAKLYLLTRPDMNPLVGHLGSGNPTIFATTSLGILDSSTSAMLKSPTRKTQHFPKELSTSKSALTYILE